MQVVQHNGFRVEVGVEHIARQRERHAHRITVVVVRDVLAPVREVGWHITRVGHLPVVQVHHLVAAVHFDDRRNDRDHVVADILDVGALIHGEAVGELHQGRGRSGLSRVNGAGDVVDRHGFLHELGGLRVIEIDRARIAELGQLGFVLFVLRHQGVAADGDRDMVATLFGLANVPGAHALRHRLGQQAHVVVDLVRIRQLGRRARDVAERGHWCRHALGSRHVVDERREEKRLGGVFLDLLRVRRVERLLRIATGLDRLRINLRVGKRRRHQEKCE